MSEQLQHLIERINAEGVQKAETEAKAILDKARAEAARLEKEAANRATETRRKAEEDAQAFAERGRKSLELAGRDLILTVQHAVERIFTSLVAARVDAALTPDQFQAILHEVVSAYLARGKKADDLAIKVAPDSEKAVRAFLLKEFQDALAAGLEIHSDNEVIKGFHVSLRKEHLEHDFTPAAIAESLARLVRPHLAEIIRAAPAAAGPDTAKPA